MRRLASLWGPPALVAGGIAFLSHLSGLGPPAPAPDWIFHGGEFALLGAVLTRALAGRLTRPLSPVVAVAAFVLATGYGVLDEFHQSFVPGRHASARDVAADAAGSAVGIGFAALIAARRSASTTPPVDLVLVTGPGCHLCEEARHALAQVGARRPIRIEVRSIAQDAELARLYGSEIPVVLLGGRKIAKGRIDTRRLEASLAARAETSA
jgi:hypothetical protein